MSDIPLVPSFDFDVVVIGAGIAGLSCAFELKQQGMKVGVLEKSRGAGGRVASRRIVDEKVFPNQPFGRHPLGTQLIALEKDLDLPKFNFPSWWRNSVQLKPLVGKIFQDHTWLKATHQALYFNQLPNEVCRQLAESVDLITQQRAISVRREAENWIVETEQQQRYQCKHVVFAIPGPQAVALLPSELNTQVLPIHQAYAPQWTAICAIRNSKELSKTQWVKVKKTNHPLSHAYRVHDTSDQTFANDIQLWTLYATPEWTQNHLDDSKEIAAQNLMNAWLELDIPTSEVIYSHAHRWLYARASAKSSDELFVEYTQLWIGGDAVAGDGIIQSVRSGLAMAQAICSHGLG